MSQLKWAAAIAFKKALLRLKVTPQITPKHKVLLHLEVNQVPKVVIQVQVTLH